jgi:hypothetical protein
VEGLHRDHSQVIREGAEARHISVTAPGGEGYDGVVWVEQSVAEKVSDLLDQAVNGAYERAGAHGIEALMVLLADRLATDQSGEVAQPAPESGRENTAGNRRSSRRDTA